MAQKSPVFKPCDFSVRIRKEALANFPEWQIYLSLDRSTRLLRVVIVPGADRILPPADGPKPSVSWFEPV